MPRIIRTEAICLAVRRLRESSKLVTMFSHDSGSLVVSARGARRPGSRFGAALERFAVSKLTFYWHENRTVYTVSDAELVRSFPSLALLPARYLAAGRITEFLLRTGRPHDPVHVSPHEGTSQLYRLTVAYLAALEQADSGFRLLVASYLFKAASFLGFRPELERCLVCGRAPAGCPAAFDPERGGLVCERCGPRASSVRLSAGEQNRLRELLGRPVAGLAASPAVSSPEDRDYLAMALEYVSCHLDSLLLNSFNQDLL